MKENTERPGKSTHAPEFEDIDIFKYGLLKDVQRTLDNCTLGFSLLNTYNDPFESSYQYVHRFKNENDRNDFFSERFKGPHSNSINKIKEIVNNELSKKVVTCFSKIPDEPLMWAHYSDKHHGVCYCFNKNTIFDKYEYKFSEVRYSNKLPCLNYFDGSTSMAHLQPQIEEVILTKSVNWAYEQEFRFYTDSSSLIHNFHPESLQGIIIGSRVDESNEDLLKTFVDAFNKKYDTNVKIMHATPSKSNYEMLINYHRVKGESTTCPVYDFSSPPILK
ncbi:DUF2971 domain-containing protein [Kangiella sp. M94]